MHIHAPPVHAQFPKFTVTVQSTSPGCLSFSLYPLPSQDVFPPNIYYKIFTYRNIVDLCAFSPRDYTSMDLRRPLPSNIHNTGKKKAVDCVKEGACGRTDNWYKRWENNGWRMVPSRVSVRECVSWRKGGL